MIVDVLKSQPSGYQLLGRCDVPALSSDFIEVIDPGARRRWSPVSPYGRPSSHRFRVVRTTLAGSRIALVPYEDASPEVLPGFKPVRARRRSR